MGSVSGRKRSATREINGNDPSDIVMDEEATGEGLVAEVHFEPREVGTDVDVLPTQTCDEFHFFLTIFVLCVKHDSVF